MTTTSATASETPRRWEPLTPPGVAELLAASPVRWWLSGGVALDRWLGHSIRERSNIDVSTTAHNLPELIQNLPTGYSAWVATPEGDDTGSAAEVGANATPWANNPDIDPQPILIRDDQANAWVLQVNVEDGTDTAWVYKRDPRLQLPWEKVVLDIDGIPTGAPEIQLLWKALRPRPEDDVDKDAVLPELSEEATTFWERRILSIHPHSTWSIHVRSPFAPAKASWNRTRARQAGQI